MMPTLRLVGSDGDEISFSPFGVGTFGMLESPGGFGAQMSQVRILEGAADGGRFRFSRRGPMDRDLPVGIFGADRASVFASLRRLSNALRVDPGGVLPRLIYPGADGVEYSTSVVLVAQAEMGTTSQDARQMRLLTLRSPDPYWTATTGVSIAPMRAAGAGRQLRPQLGNMRVTASQVLGSVLVENPGDLDAAMVWVVRGPATSAAFTHEDGRSFSLGAFDAATTITVDTATGLVRDQDGVDRYDLLGSAPKLFPIAGGSSTVDVAVVGATDDTLVSGYFLPKVEVIF
jgi:hypothetical protein